MVQDDRRETLPAFLPSRGRIWCVRRRSVGMKLRECSSGLLEAGLVSSMESQHGWAEEDDIGEPRWLFDPRRR